MMVVITAMGQTVVHNWGTMSQCVYSNASSSYAYFFTIPQLILHLTLDLYILPQCLQGMERVCVWVGRWARAWESSLKVLWHRRHSNWRREEWEARWRRRADLEEKVLLHSPHSSPNCSVDQHNTQLAGYSVKQILTYPEKRLYQLSTYTINTSV